MPVEGIRFRAEGALIVLQVLEVTEDRAYDAYQSSAYRNVNKEEWRDAKVEDLLQVSKFTNGRKVESVAAELAALTERYESTRESVQALAEQPISHRASLSPEDQRKYDHFWSAHSEAASLWRKP